MRDHSAARRVGKAPSPALPGGSAHDRRAPWAPCLAFGLAVLAAAGSVTTAFPQASGEPLTVAAYPATVSARPGQWLPVAVVFDLKPKWHIHTNDPKVPPELGSPEDFIRTAIGAKPDPDGRLRADLGAIQWPKPVMVKVSFGGPTVDYGVFEGRAIAYVPVEVPSDASTGIGRLTLNVSYQACDDKICVAPVTGKPLTVEIAIDPNAKGWPDESLYPDLFAGLDPARIAGTSAAVAGAGGTAARTPAGGGGGMTIGIVAAAAALVALLVGFFVIKKVL
jgi:hypothetical protein